MFALHTPEVHTALDRVLADRAYIDLGDLPQDSALMTRTDRKYVLDPLNAAKALRSQPELVCVTVDGRTSSAYESVYFDTPDLRTFHDAAHSRRHRFKVRTRTYLDSGTTLLEVKTKGGRGQTVKERIAVQDHARNQLKQEERHFITSTLERSGVHEPDQLVANLTPSLTTRYRRSTLLGPDYSRVTIDTDLTCTRGAHTSTHPMLVLIETKSAGHATATDKALWRAGIRPVSISKYAAGLLELEPRLPANKWHRVLRTTPLTHHVTHEAA